MENELTFNPDGPWSLYSPVLPLGFRALGTVTRGGYDTGALLQNIRTGLYVQANAGALRTLPQREVRMIVRVHA